MFASDSITTRIDNWVNGNLEETNLTTSHVHINISIWQLAHNLNAINQVSVSFSVRHYGSSKGVRSYSSNPPPTRDSWFTFKPESSSKDFRISNSEMYENLSLRKQVISSAKEDNLTVSRPILRPWIWLSLLILRAKISRTIINKYGERGSPCLTPLPKEKGPVAYPLFITALDAFLYSTRIHWIKDGPKLNLYKILFFNLCAKCICLVFFWFLCWSTLEWLYCGGNCEKFPTRCVLLLGHYYI